MGIHYKKAAYRVDINVLGTRFHTFTGDLGTALCITKRMEREEHHPQIYEIPVKEYRPHRPAGRHIELIYQNDEIFGTKSPKSLEDLEKLVEAGENK
ncbi:MAG: hypothetical protein ABIJ20_00480 [Nanoarchaeota archaeon]|nr:hypothetical protein [Nanoarchaeota archaeon]MBU1445383.1 hypothetical protein [Nanoarchaeota archaeon]MBU2406749.1 hypothetical protein [Nanoarchaeota archaeon]MBU2420156.1 hypothetical protein [Nanoarchaeota archaeon]MBU2475269.1 hypothetical protein [Nanoarchaeota archaeon]